MEFVRAVERLGEALKKIGDEKIDFFKTSPKAIYDYNEKRFELLKAEVNQAIGSIRTFYKTGLEEIGGENAETVSLIEDLDACYKRNDTKGMMAVLEKIKKHVPNVQTGKKQLSELRIIVPPLPLEIREEVALDLTEAERCYNNNCFRSVAILCGRILETALFRKYYEATGDDLLETSPNLGLGKLIAKLKEKNVVFDPGLTEQMHLINQVRISSVHKKSNNFYPTKEQAYAMLLYTLDVLKKLF